MLAHEPSGSVHVHNHIEDTHLESVKNLIFCVALMASRFFCLESQRQSLELERGADLGSNRLHIYFLSLPLYGYHTEEAAIEI